MPVKLAVKLADAPLLMHATAVALGDKVALLRGKSGAGKSDLALRFLAGEAGVTQCGGLGAGIAKPRRLVADDQVLLTREGEYLIARAPDTIKGRLEVRGLGIIDVTAVAMGTVCVLVDLVAPSDVLRLPDERYETVLGVQLPVLNLAPFEASAAIKLAIFISRLS